MRSVLTVIAVLALPAAASAETLYYGSRAGMEVTVVSKSGLDTKKAVIKVKHTKENATAFCRDYVGKVTKKCIADELAVKLASSITADCLTGKFTNFYGEKLRFIGPNPGGDPEYIIQGPRGVLDGSMASGYGNGLEQFTALCPSRVSN